LILDDRKVAILAKGEAPAALPGVSGPHGGTQVETHGAPAELAANPGPRLRIWEIDPAMHCSILGTCLTMNDLYALARRARVRLDPRASAYQVHSWFVDYMMEPNELSKLVDKTLEKRHGNVAAKVRRARSEAELETRWKLVAGEGRIAGAYWGAMSHRLCSKKLRWALFGEIHMLSHLVGSSRRADLCRVQELEATCAALDDTLAGIKHVHRAAIRDRKKLEEDLDARRRELGHVTRRLKMAEERIAALQSQTLANEREARIETLERTLAEAKERKSVAESALDDLRKPFEAMQRATELATAELRELRAENAALEAEVAVRMSCSRTLAPDDGDRAEPCGLRGKRILCVGGVRSLVQHYRELVERRGGEFLHHDGGLEESLDAVTRALATVDVVFCPTDCVSHAACLKVKKACKNLAKPFVPLRSSGLSSFARGIQAIARPMAAADTDETFSAPAVSSKQNERA
jgi:hypothetical protein